MSIPITELRQGAVYKENNEPLLVVKYSHTKMGRGMATIKLKVRNLKSGTLTEKTYSSGSKVEETEVNKRGVQFLYFDGKEGVFMAPDTFEQFTLSESLLQESLPYLVAGTKVLVLFYENEPIGVELPKNVNLKVDYAEPGVRGDTANAALIKVQLETGLEVMTPMFVKTGDVVKIDTRTGDYVERVN